MELPSSASPAAVFPATYHRAAVEEWENYDSVEEEMRAISYSYVEALHFAADGTVVGMAKIGCHDTDPESNGATALSPDCRSSYNFTGRWEWVDGHLRADLGPASDKVSLSAEWVGIFYLPGRITLREGALDGEELRAVVSYDRHPIWDGGPVSAVFRRVGG